MLKSWQQKKWNQKFYYFPKKEDYLYKTPHFFFKALVELFKRRPDLKRIIKVKFIGETPEWLDAMIREFGLENNCCLYGPLLRNEALILQAKFDAFLSTTSKPIQGQEYALNTKVFDYIQMRKPILGFVADGPMKDFLKDCGLAFIFDPDKSHESSILLEKVVEGGYTLKPNSAYLSQFHRRYLTGKLAEIIKNVVHENHFDRRHTAPIY